MLLRAASEGRAVRQMWSVTTWKLFTGGLMGVSAACVVAGAVIASAIKVVPKTN